MDDPVRNPYLSPNSTAQSSRNSSTGGTLAAHVRIGQIITFALVQGIVFMGAIFVYLSFDGPANPPPAGAAPAGDDILLPAIGIAVAVSCCVVALIVPAIVRRKAALLLAESGQKVDLPVQADVSMSSTLQEFLAASQTATLIGQAALEGAATVNLILMFIGGSWIHLPLAICCAVGIALQVPTTGKVEQAIESAVRS